MVPLSPLAGALASLAIGAFFAAADTAVTSLSSSRLDALVDQASKDDRAVYERIRDHHAEIRSRYLLGRVASPAVTAICLLDVFLPSFPQGAGWIALGAAVFLTAIAFEVTTTLARKHADAAALWSARWMRPLEMLMVPLAVPIGLIGRMMARQTADLPADPGVVEAHVGALVDEGERTGVLAGEPATMIRNVLDFADLTAKDVMIPRDKVHAIDVGDPMAEIVQFVSKSGHSRYPVYSEEIDNVVGLLYAKDLYKALHPGQERRASERPSEGAAGASTAVSAADGSSGRATLRALMRVPNFVPESRPLATLLREMRWRRHHLAIVVDEFGAISGVVTLEDIVQEIVGEFHDEKSTATQPSDVVADKPLPDGAGLHPDASD